MGEAALVLAGGFSRRMGNDKWSLPFGGETLLERTVRIVREVVPEVWVVAREGQGVRGRFRIARDPAEGMGPLAGLAAGLEAMAADRAFLTSCDVPFLRPALVRRLLDLSRGHLAAVPFVDGYHMTTAAVYARDALPAARRLLAEGRLRPFFLVEELRARIVTAEEIRDVDPSLESFRNCNTPGEYRAALRDAGLEPPAAGRPRGKEGQA
ncbi:MAG: molybdenum cofactor guanylyltransferase [Planctomycetes bacterium]|nr:molybdenum cofactor guanylyltransferase [Planctomycetota bacterium]